MKEREDTGEREWEREGEREREKARGRERKSDKQEIMSKIGTTIGARNEGWQEIERIHFFHNTRLMLIRPHTTQQTFISLMDWANSNVGMEVPASSTAFCNVTMQCDYQFCYLWRLGHDNVLSLFQRPLSGTRGRQAAHHYAHLTPSLRASALHGTHLDSITSLITSTISVTSSVSSPCPH
jgi:hypothetical protein